MLGAWRKTLRDSFRKARKISLRYTVPVGNRCEVEILNKKRAHLRGFLFLGTFLSGGSKEGGQRGWI